MTDTERIRFREAAAERNEAKAALSRLEKELARKTEALERYGRHDFECKAGIFPDANNECDCGLSAALTEGTAEDAKLAPEDVISREQPPEALMRHAKALSEERGWANTRPGSAEDGRQNVDACTCAVYTDYGTGVTRQFAHCPIHGAAEDTTALTEPPAWETLHDGVLDHYARERVAANKAAGIDASPGAAEDTTALTHEARYADPCWRNGRYHVCCSCGWTDRASDCDAAEDAMIAHLGSVSAVRSPASDGCRTCHRPWTECVC